MEEKSVWEEGYSEPEWMKILNGILENKRKVLNRRVDIEYNSVAAEVIRV